ncbi:MAG: glycosyltransferase family 2 protein [Anaerolineae bacterium]|nr:glycosyltransferase family 2 protein [Anaerolineae bacterium]
MNISVVITSRNRRDSLRQTLASLEAQTVAPHEVIVVDDGSTDGTGEMLAAAFPDVVYVRREQHGGPAAARNQGIRAATGDLIAFTDDDSIPPPRWLEGHLHHFDDARVGAVGGPSIPPDPNFFDQVDIVRYADLLHDQLRRIERLTGWEGLGTGNMTVRRAIFDEVGYFDEAFLTGSDPEFTRRVVRLGGYALIVDPSLVVAHMKWHTLRSYLRTRFHRGCGAVLTDLKEGSLSWRRFLPVPNLLLGWREWRTFRRRFGGGALTFLRYWALFFLVRWVTVAGRAYYYWTAGRPYRRRDVEQ